jgi:hypothetical protein
MFSHGEQHYKFAGKPGMATGQWLQYSTPGAEGAEYIAVCLPAFSPDTVHRDPSISSTR